MPTLASPPPLKKAAPPKTDPQLALLFDAILPPGKTQFSPKELAAALGLNEDTINRAFALKDDKRRLMGLGIYVTGTGDKLIKRIFRAEALLWIMQYANFTRETHFANIDDFVRSLSTNALEHLAAESAIEFALRQK